MWIDIPDINGHFLILNSVRWEIFKCLTFYSLYIFTLEDVVRFCCFFTLHRVWFKLLKQALPGFCFRTDWSHGCVCHWPVLIMAGQRLAVKRLQSVQRQAVHSRRSPVVLRGVSPPQRWEHHRARETSPHRLVAGRNRLPTTLKPDRNPKFFTAVILVRNLPKQVTQITEHLY